MPFSWKHLFKRFMRGESQMDLHGIGLGTFPFSKVFGPIDELEATNIVHLFLDHGGRYIQTAPYYKGVDPLIGKILRKIPRDKFNLGTLCVKDRQSVSSGKYASIISQCEDSLQQLGLDYIDLYLTSTTKAKDAAFAETIQAMLDLKKQGKVREIGVCNVNLSQLKEYNSNGAIKYVQNRFSLIDQVSDKEVREYCVKEKIGLVPYNVIEWGLLTNKILQPFTLPETDLRKKALPVFNDEPVSVLRNWVITYLKPLSDHNHVPIEALAIFWILSQPGVAVCPVGATKKEQILSSLMALKLRGRSDILHEMNRAYEELESAVKSRYKMELNDFLRNSYGKF